MRYNMLGAPQAKILWSAPSKSRFYYLFWLLELMPGHLRRSILWILVLNPTHEISWSRSGFFFSAGTDSEGWAPGPPLFSCFCFLPPSLSLGSAGPPTFREIKNAPPCPPETSDEAVCTIWIRVRCILCITRDQIRCVHMRAVRFSVMRLMRLGILYV